MNDEIISEQSYVKSNYVYPIVGVGTLAGYIVGIITGIGLTRLFKKIGGK